MAFDGIVLKNIVDELNTCLINGKISKVFEPNKNEIILGIYNNGKNYALNISIDSNNYRMNLTTTSKPNPFNALNFCMFLRKHIIGNRIVSINSYDLERIVYIELEGFNELNDKISKTLIIELMGKHSNIILVNSNKIIIDSLRHLDTSSNSVRDILPAHPYAEPKGEKQTFLDLTNFDEFYNSIINSAYPITSSIPNLYTGISKLFIENCIDTLNIENSAKNKEDLEKLYNYILSILNTSAVLKEVKTNNNKTDYTLFLDESSPLCNNFFLDDYYTSKETDEQFKTYRNNILKLILNELKKYSKRLYNINQKLEECNLMDTYKLYGELITANLYKINNSINIDSIELENYYDDNNLIVIPLDKSLTPANNAKKYFKKYNKLKTALELVQIQKKDTAKEINYLESIVYELETSKTIEDINSIYNEISENVIFKERLASKKKNKPSSKNKENIDFNPLEIQLDGYTVYIGKNNKQNDQLTLKFARNNDLWFHTKQIHGSHVILKTNGDEIAQSTINKCAAITAYHSKAKDSSNVPVDYTFVKFVKKPSGAKPGMVIYTNYTTVNVMPKEYM